MSAKYKPLRQREFLFINPYRNFMPNQLRQKDYDKDGVPNNKDCRPLNHWRQHLSKRRKEEIDRLKISVAYLDENRRYHKVPLSSLKAKQKAPYAVEQVYSTLNRHPHLIRELDEMTEKDWVESKHTRGLHQGYVHEDIHRKNLLGKSKRGGGRIVTNVSAWSDKDGFVPVPSGVDSEIISKPQDILAAVLSHERQHEKQSSEDKDMVYKYDKHTATALKVFDFNVSGRNLENLSEEQMEVYAKIHKSNPYETEAAEMAQRQLEKRLKFPPKEEVDEGFRETMKD